MAIAAAIILPIGLLFLLSGLIINFIQLARTSTIPPHTCDLPPALVELYTDQETYDLMGKEDALVISNHRSDIDWLVGWVIAQVLGWSMWFSGYISLERSWAKDENTLKSGFQQLNDFHQPFWLAVSVEGTRFTHTKLLAAQEYATSAGLPIPSYLIFVLVRENIVQCLEEYVGFMGFCY
ncbi:PREDICTED: 1-acyl-sn-glycerol-3-phosphate acyltransferase PLS1-like isoform X2 [Nicotiana attenuata]|uniref:1-acyl-sn-glycerol-3-phosphate acyltransferase PLS1-like isoform X2 n=1 Tax=Nicotiana attenuata TaxID=49451 RepID=UPI00090549BC|nr:PREDICTED: 1-acyl-sn-glycerol-3-phosphate acyltransferase PLS1-like isoform X2 [Nicotiana attenuata]